MLSYIEVENFRKHAARRVEFTPGINAIRADVEQGKSTLLEAITYCFFGAAGLKEPIADVVTYDVPVNKLSAEVGFNIAGVDYALARSPKGAELVWDGGRITGQKEVTLFCERLLGASASMASKLLLAKQKDLAGALAEGPTAAGKMIEDLADLSLIDELAGLVREKLPSGHTDSQRALVESLRAQAAPAETENLLPLEAALEDARATVQTVQRELQYEKAKLQDLDVDAAREILTNEKVLQSKIEAATEAIQRAQVALARPPLPKVADSEIEALQARIAGQKDLAAAARLHAELLNADTTMQWDEDLPALQAEIEKASAAQRAADTEQTRTRAALRAAQDAEKARKASVQVQIARLTGKLVLEESCAFCGKDLKDVPEVALINNPLYAQIKALEAQPAADLAPLETAADAASARYQEAFEYSQALQAVVKVNDKLQGLYGRAAKYITLDESVVPAQWAWTGPTDAPQDFASELAALQQKQRLWQARQNEDTVAHMQLGQLLIDIKRHQADLAQLPLADARETLDLHKQLDITVAGLAEQLQYRERAMTAAHQALELARQRYLDRQLVEKRAKEQLAAAEATLAEMEENNVLIKKLQGARPAITDKLWTIVLSASSTYTADVRGEPSTLTREDGRFKINGRPVTGLSGSAEDVLGLGMRFALTKTFLTNVDFVMLDEPAAACNDERETALLGLLATSGFAQTILVTHSDLSDAFADNIIRF